MTTATDSYILGGDADLRDRHRAIAQHGKCGDGSVERECFFPPSNGKSHAPWHAKGRKVCVECPVRSECLQWALGFPEPDGLWGGVTPDERSALLGWLDRHGRDPLSFTAEECDAVMETLVVRKRGQAREKVDA